MRDMLEPDVLEELRVLGGENRLAQTQRDLLIADDDAALDREVADDRAVASRARA